MRMQVGERPNSATSSTTLAPAAALAMIASRWLGVKFGPLGVFPVISVPNTRRGGIVIVVVSVWVVWSSGGVAAWQPKLLTSHCIPVQFRHGLAPSHFCLRFRQAKQACSTLERLEAFLGGIESSR